MGTSEKINSFHCGSGGHPSAVRASWDPRHVKGVLLLGGPEAKFDGKGVPRTSLESEVQFTRSLTEACRRLRFRKYRALVVLPDALDATDKSSLPMLRKLAGDACFIVLSGVTEVPALDAGISTAPNVVAPESDVRLYPNFGTPQEKVVSVGPIVGDRASGMITVNEKPLLLSPTLWRILWRLLDAPQNRLHSSELIETMRNPGLSNTLQTLRVHIHRLRQKLSQFGASGLLISSRGGYSLYSGTAPSIRQRSQSHFEHEF